MKFHPSTMRKEKSWQRNQPLTRELTSGPQIFSLFAPNALSVQLVGDFTDWQGHPIEMQKSTSGVWQAAVHLETGPHHYRFLVDGEWRDDPGCTVRTPNDFGSQNMVADGGVTSEKIPPECGWRRGGEPADWIASDGVPFQPTAAIWRPGFAKSIRQGSGPFERAAQPRWGISDYAAGFRNNSLNEVTSPHQLRICLVTAKRAPAMRSCQTTS